MIDIINGQKSILMLTGNLTVIIGPMYSGKTSKLFDFLTKYRDLFPSDKKVLYINHLFDKSRKTKGDNNGISTHSVSSSYNMENIDIIYTKFLPENVDKWACIGVDECQFFDDISNIRKWVDEGKIVYVSGLRSDFMKNKIGKTLDLISFADDLIQTTAICKICLKNGTYTPAPFTCKRDISNREVIIEIGAEETYYPACKKHYVS